MMYLMADSDLGTRIRRARERKRWTQQQLADALSTPEHRVGLRTVGSWERNEAVPRIIGAIEQILNVDLTSDDEPDPREEEIRGMDWLTPAEQAQWIALYRARQRQGPPPGRERAS